MTLQRAGQIFGLALAILSVCGEAGAQSPAPDAKPAETKAAEAKPAPVYETLYLTNLTQQNDLNDIQSAIRNVVPRARVYGMPSERAISLWATPDEMAIAKRVLADLDKPRKVYRLTFTFTEIVDGKRGGAQQFSLVAASGEKTEMRQGNRIPLVTGTVNESGTSPTTQVQYVDLGLNLEVTVDGLPDGARLRTKIERSSLSEDKSGLGAQDPVIRQTRLEETAVLTLGKPLVLGSLEGLADAQGPARRLEVEVLAEAVK